MKQITLFFFLILFVFASHGQDLKITEIMYNPSGVDNPWEWIEVYNNGTTSIDLSGYVLDDASGVALAASNISIGLLEPQQSAILFDADDITQEQFEEVWGDVNLIAVSNWSTLGNTGDTIGIWDNYESYDGDNQTQLNTVENLTYNNTDDGWPNDDGKASIFLSALELDNATGANWMLSVNGIQTPLNSTYVSLEFHDNSGTDIGSPGIPAGAEDTEKPIITCPQDITIAAEPDFCESSFPLVLPEATDNAGGELTYIGARSDSLDLIFPFPVGETTISWTAIDEAGNISEPCLQKIIIEDETDPIISCGENIEATSLDGNSVMVEIDNAIASDVCEGDITISGVRSDEEELQSPYPLGETTILWQAIDASGNMTECMQTIVIGFVPSEENTITSFRIEGQIDETEIDIANKTVQLVMPIGTDVTVLTAEIEISTYASINPEIGTYLDFSAPQTYVVTAQDGTTQEWVIEVKIKEDIIPPSFEVKGNTSDFTTELEVGDTYVVGAITNIVDESPTTTEITGNELVDSSQEGGHFTIIYQVSDGANMTIITESVIVNTIEINEFEVLSFTLINADTNEDLFTIEEGMQIDINSLPTMHLDIRANSTEDVESVRLCLEGALSTSRTESLLPYALFQDLPIGDYKGKDFILGAYAVSAIPYSEDSLRGDIGNPLAINFAFIDSCENFEVILEVITSILTCSGADGGAIILANGGVAPIKYVWSHDEQLNSPMASELTAGEYTVTAIDANNCTSELTFSLKDPEFPEVTMLPFESVLDTEEPIVLFEGQPFGGSYSGEGVEDGEFNPSVGKGIYEITYSYVDEVTGCANSATGEIEVFSTEVLAVESFTLVNADTNEDLFELQEGMIIDINNLPTIRLDIRANTSETVESVRLSLSGAQTSSRTESLIPYALFQDLPIGDYKGNDFVVGEYAVTALPYSIDGARGNLGTPFQINFELVDPSLLVMEFMLVNADTNEDIFLIEEGMAIDINELPTLHLDVRAITTDDVESVRLSLAGALTTERTESLVPYALFQDLPIGDYKGSDFVLGAYAVTAVPYSLNSLGGETGTALTINFELVAVELSGRHLYSMIISPNPANIKTVLSFETPVDLMTIVIYDTHGRLVRTIDGKKIKDEEVYKLETESLQSGNYFIKTIAKNGIIHNAQMLVKKQ